MRILLQLVGGSFVWRANLQGAVAVLQVDSGSSGCIVSVRTPHSTTGGGGVRQFAFSNGFIASRVVADITEAAKMAFADTSGWSFV